ncbi:MAG: 8-amino-7-oxononanoate synthase [Bacteroidia bacterium]|nr:8-amino-7-oxononanoate synthase [Bacteroidia bacterium]
MLSYKKLLEKRSGENSLRKLSSPASATIDFCSNDYIGFARSEELEKAISSFSVEDKIRLNGSTGSRLLTGNSIAAEQLEQFISTYHKAETGLLFNSGYDANVGLFSCIAQRSDTILYDELSHASIIDGLRLSNANTYKFRHNDVAHLEELLKRSQGTIYVAVESVYSMDGDCAPLEAIVRLVEKYNAHLIVDEAHATGVFGLKGEGRVVELTLEQRVFARIHTFGKAMGCHGAIVVGCNDLKQYLINFARSFIYSTALPQHSLAAIKCAYLFLQTNTQVIDKLKSNIIFFKEQARSIKNSGLIESISPIQSVLIGNIDQTKNISKEIYRTGFDVRPILSPTVPVGTERLRICLHSYNTKSEIEELIKILSMLKVR